MSKHSYDIDWTQPQITTGKRGSYSNIDYMQTNFAPQGWQCPVCKRVLAPFVQECPCGGQGMQTWTSTISTDDIKPTTVTMKYPEDFKKEDEQLGDMPLCYCNQAKHIKESK